ncbi:MAG: shikimate dehydrogenase [Acidobacteriota bacterium]|nr:shikimate dehydrogenase [Acidobacteriota bacterium]
MTGAPRRSPQWPSAASAVVAVMGDPVRHSLSPLLHNAAFDAMGLDWVSVAFEVPAGQGAVALAGARALGLAGLSVTTPHKEDAFVTVDERSALATRLGAVNCVTLEGGLLVGDSTDGAGFLAALHRAAGVDPSGRRCLVVGAGGAARAVVAALGDAGAAEVAVLNRDGPRAEAAAGLAGPAGRVAVPADLAGAEVVVQASSVGLGDPTAVHLLVDVGLFHEGQVVADLVYHPSRTALLAAAAGAGATTLNGLGMLVHQAALAVERWTGRAAPVEAMWAAVTPAAGEGAS